MSDAINPADDALTAIKNRTAGPIGTFILVWALSHRDILSYLLFDATGKSDMPQAQAKIAAITDLLKEETIWSLIFWPAFSTVLVLGIGQIILLLWHIVADQFRYLRERVSYKNDMRIFLYRRFGQNPDDLIATIRSEISASILDVNNIPRSGDHIQAINELVKLQSTMTNVNQRAVDLEAKLKNVLKLIELAGEKPLISFIRELKNKESSGS